jgi:ammonia channel protein AmtB
VVIGPRVGKYGKDGRVNVIPGHNIPMAIIGTFILAFGWFGFNPGSTLAATDLRISIVAVNTMLASASGAFLAMVYVWAKYGKPDPGMLANGMLAGLVAITAPCAFVTATSAIIIGAVSGVLVVVVYNFLDSKLKIDDPVGAFAVHGANGLWGVLALGLFADGKYGDDWNTVSMGILFGLVIGKPLGSFLVSRLMVALNIAHLPSNTQWKQLLGMGTLAGIGFTMSIFTTMLAFREDSFRDIAKISVLLAVVVSTVISIVYFRAIGGKYAIKPVNIPNTQKQPQPQTDLGLNAA